jgi:restriction endonuclease Mrr
LSGAREEAASPTAAPVRLFDGAQLARVCEEHGVGVVNTRVTLPTVDGDLFESLRNG